MKHRSAAVQWHFFILCLLTLTCGLISSEARAEFQKTKIAVLDFEQIGDNFETRGLGPIVAEWFTHGMVRSGRFDVVERAVLQKILTERKMMAPGMSDVSGAADLGKMLGVKAVATGSVIKNRQSIEVNSRVVNVTTGEIVAADSYRSNSEEDLHDLVDQLVEQPVEVGLHDLVDQLAAGIIRNYPLTGYVEKRSGSSVVIDVGLDSGLAPGTEFIVYREGEVIRHPKTGEVLDVRQIHTGRLRITRISRNVAEGEILAEERGGIEDRQLVQSVLKEKTQPPARIAPPPGAGNPYNKASRDGTPH